MLICMKRRIYYLSVHFIAGLVLKPRLKYCQLYLWVSSSFFIELCTLCHLTIRLPVQYGICTIVISFTGIWKLTTCWCGLLMTTVYWTSNFPTTVSRVLPPLRGLLERREHPGTKHRKFEPGLVTTKRSVITYMWRFWSTELQKADARYKLLIESNA